MEIFLWNLLIILLKIIIALCGMALIVAVCTLIEWGFEVITKRNTNLGRD